MIKEKPPAASGRLNADKQGKDKKMIRKTKNGVISLSNSDEKKIKTLTKVAAHSSGQLHSLRQGEIDGDCQKFNYTPGRFLQPHSPVDTVHQSTK